MFQRVLLPGLAQFPRRVSASPARSPCAGCPLESNVRVVPAIARARIAAVGLAPGADEERTLRNFTGPSGAMLRGALAGAGLDPARDAAYLNITRCRPAGDDFEGAGWKDAARRCSAYLAADIAAAGMPSVLVLGSKPLRLLSGDAKASASRQRGLWFRLAAGGPAFAARHPAGILRETDPSERERLTAEFRADVRRMADRILGRERLPSIGIEVYCEPAPAVAALRVLVRHAGPWAFDVETYDVAAYPSRPGVATDPCHPDFRVRGVGIATGPHDGFWLELRALAEHAALRGALASAFASSAPKVAFFGHFDEEALIYGGWVPAVRNRAGDPALAMAALGDGRTSGSLARGVVDILGEPQHWGAFDKARVRDAPLVQVAEGCVRDACATLRLDGALEGRLLRGEYL